MFIFTLKSEILNSILLKPSYGEDKKKATSEINYLYLDAPKFAAATFVMDVPFPLERQVLIIHDNRSVKVKLTLKELFF